VVNADGTGARLLATSGTQPRFSPDGTQIAFNRGGEIWTMHADGSEQRQLTQASESDFAPIWSPNGRMIAFVRGTPEHQIYVMNGDGSNQRPLAPSSAWQLDPDWSPDGKRISFARCTSGLARTCDLRIANVG
jgi:Tol biopolymer transport system component